MKVVWIIVITLLLIGGIVGLIVYLVGKEQYKSIDNKPIYNILYKNNLNYVPVYNKTYKEDFELLKLSKKFNKGVDFVSIVFDDKIELELLKLQAHSFKFVDKDIINSIYVIYNDFNDKSFNKLFNNTIINFYPKYLRSKVKIIYRIDLGLHLTKSSWRNQQLIKLLISKLINSNYYIILDTKNHFIRYTDINDFISNGKPNLFVNNPGTMIKYYYNGLKYFKCNCPFNYIKNGKSVDGGNILLTTTPYLFKTQDVLDLMNYIQQKEKTPFRGFFMKRKDLTEFYLYSTYLIYTGKINEYNLRKRIHFSIMNNPNKTWNSYKNASRVISNSNFKIFGLHRSAVKKMNTEYKQNLIKLYTNFYDPHILTFIKKNILKI